MSDEAASVQAYAEPKKPVASLLGLPLETRLEIYKLLSIKSEPCPMEKKWLAILENPGNYGTLLPTSNATNRQANNAASENQAEGAGDHMKDLLERRKCAVMFFKKELRLMPMRSMPKKPDDLLPLLKTCSTTYMEALPVWSKVNAIRIRESSLELPKTSMIFEKMSKERLQFVRYVFVLVERRASQGWHDPIAFLRFEESLPANVRVLLLLPDSQTCRIWFEVYSLAKKHRDAGMSWDDVGVCGRHVQHLLELTQFLVEELVEDEDSDEDIYDSIG